MPGTDQPGKRGDGETTRTILTALAADLLIAAAKVAGGVIAGSPALLSEGAHSVADSCNQVFLLTALHRSRRRPDRGHPFGYGKERYFWSMLAAVGIFVTGGCFSFYQGVQTLRRPEALTGSGFVVSAAVLGFALLAEGTSLVRAVLQVAREARRTGRSLRRALRGVEDPTVRTVLAEDSTAVLGVLFAAVGVVGHRLSGSAAWEAAGALAIGALLVYVAYRLGRTAKDLLIGVAVDPALQHRAYRMLSEQPEIDAVTSLMTMRLGPGSALLAARVDLEAGLESEAVERACVRVKKELAERCPEFAEIFLDITDAGREERAQGRRMGEELRRFGGSGPEDPPKRLS